MNWSEHQERIFDWAINGKGSVIVNAVAGSGKTTTITEMASRIMTHDSRSYMAFIAFNKSIVEELKVKLPKEIRPTTFHGLGMSTWGRHLGPKGRSLQVDDKKTFKIMKEQLSEEQMETYLSILPKVISIAKGAGIVPSMSLNQNTIALTRDTDETWIQLIEHYSIDVDNQLEAIDLARKILSQSIVTGDVTIDYDDMLYLPIIKGARFWQNDWVIVDEAQDVNKIQRAVLKRSLKPGGRLVAVGDRHQAIYGFRGADTSSIDSIRREFGASELPLTVSYRCPQAVVKEAQRFVDHIQAHESAPLGIVCPKIVHSKSCGYDSETISCTCKGQWLVKDFLPTDAIVCRNTAPLVELAFFLLSKRIGCKILGRAIGDGLIGLVKKMKANGVDRLMEKLSAYRDRETAKFLAQGEEQKADNLNDRVNTLLAFISELPETNRTIPALIQSIQSIFTDNGKGLLTLCTVHKSKGLEWPRVFILDADKLMPSPWARQEWQQEQERNLQYVAITRAKSELYYLSSDDIQK